MFIISFWHDDVKQERERSSMIKTILFDLDGTLMHMDQDLFIHEYFKLIAGYFAERG